MMDLSTGVNVGQLLLAIGAVLLASGVAWGGLLQRVGTLERQVETMSGFAADIAVIKTSLAHTGGQVDTLVSKLLDSWLLKDPPGYEAPKPTNRRR